MQRKPPKYFFIRIYIIAIIVYLLLLIPINIFLSMKYLPQFAEDDKGLQKFLKFQFNIQEEVKQPHQDTLATDSLSKAMISEADTTGDADPMRWDANANSKNKNGVAGRKSIFFPFLLLSLIFLIIYNYPFRRYFKKKRKGKPLPDNLTRYCRKHLLQTPLVNTGLLFLPFLIELIHSFFLLSKGWGPYGEPVIQEIFNKTIAIDVIASILVSMFSYLWLKNRVQLRYIDHIYPQEQLREGVFKGKKQHFRGKLWLSSTITTLMPLAIVVYYLVVSFRAVDSLGIETFTTQHNQILFGPYLDMLNNLEATEMLGQIYINAIDSILLLFGVIFSTIVSLIYLSLVGKWNTRLIVLPVNELLEDMERTSQGEMESYGVVRSNDEIGQLTRGYNNMVQKLKTYFDELNDMNRNLEAKVKARTSEIAQQKEEIEAQRDKLFEQKNEIETQRDEITQQRDLLSTKNSEINDSIHYARRIQEAMLPLESQFRTHLPKHFIYYQPRDIVSGDFYWIKKTEDQVIFTAADCTGHGVPGAFMSLLGMAFLNEVVTYMHITQPALILKELRNKVKTALKQNSGELKAKDGMDMSLVTLDLKTHKLQFAGAYNPLYLFRNGELERIEADRMPIGVHLNEKPEFTNHEIQLKQGDLIYMTSDGYIDQFGGEKNKKFKSGRFKSLLQKIQHLPMEEQEQQIYETMQEWMGNNEQLDDIIVIGVRV